MYFSDENPIAVTITEPKIKIVQVGESVTLRCNVQTNGQVRYFQKYFESILKNVFQSDVSITWNKENGVLPTNRIRSNTNGILIITDVRAEDSGNYICVAENAYFIATDTATLNIGKNTFYVILEYIF